MQAATSPISGVLGDKYDRTHIVAFGCFLWGIMTALIGFSTSLHQVCLVVACPLSNSTSNMYTDTNVQHLRFF